MDTFRVRFFSVLFRCTSLVFRHFLSLNFLLFYLLARFTELVETSESLCLCSRIHLLLIFVFAFFFVQLASTPFSLNVTNRSRPENLMNLIYVLFKFATFPFYFRQFILFRSALSNFNFALYDTLTRSKRNF